MDTDYRQRNRHNLQALISYVRDTDNPTTNTMEYVQLGGMVLLGKGHSAGDMERVTGAQGDWKFSGRIGIHLDKTKKVLQKTEKKLIVRIQPQVKGGMSELQGAISDAAAGTDVAGTPIQFDWA